jgi:hypothetical protein
MEAAVAGSIQAARTAKLAMVLTVLTNLPSSPVF